MEKVCDKNHGFISPTLITFIGLIGGLVSVSTIVTTIGVAHYRIGQNESAISITVPQAWAEQHIQHPHTNSVTDEKFIMVQGHIDYKIGQVEKDVSRIENIVDGMDQKVDQILSKIQGPR